ncbi:hypothetical protein K3495_g3144 [Podosphaera aphanis]|nr:hypothetical protein K3495_g3144 [Podosphaera aphanis]
MLHIRFPVDAPCRGMAQDRRRDVGSAWFGGAAHDSTGPTTGACATRPDARSTRVAVAVAVAPADVHVEAPGWAATTGCEADRDDEMRNAGVSPVISLRPGA